MQPRTAQLVAAIAASLLPDLYYKDRKHWEIAAGRWRLARWHPEAPCKLVPKQPHRLSLIRIRKF